MKDQLASKTIFKLLRNSFFLESETDSQKAYLLVDVSIDEDIKALSPIKSPKSQRINPSSVARFNSSASITRIQQAITVFYESKRPFGIIHESEIPIFLKRHISKYKMNEDKHQANLDLCKTVINKLVKPLKKKNSDDLIMLEFDINSKIVNYLIFGQEDTDFSVKSMTDQKSLHPFDTINIFSNITSLFYHKPEFKLAHRTNSLKKETKEKQSKETEDNHKQSASMDTRSNSQKRVTFETEETQTLKRIEEILSKNYPTTGKVRAVSEEKPKRSSSSKKEKFYEEYSPKVSQYYKSSNSKSVNKSLNKSYDRSKILNSRSLQNISAYADILPIDEQNEITWTEMSPPKKAESKAEPNANVNFGTNPISTKETPLLKMQPTDIDIESPRPAVKDRNPYTNPRDDNLITPSFSPYEHHVNKSKLSDISKQDYSEISAPFTVDGEKEDRNLSRIQNQKFDDIDNQNYILHDISSITYNEKQRRINDTYSSASKLELSTNFEFNEFKSEHKKTSLSPNKKKKMNENELNFPKKYSPIHKEKYYMKRTAGYANRQVIQTSEKGDSKDSSIVSSSFGFSQNNTPFKLVYMRNNPVPSKQSNTKNQDSSHKKEPQVKEVQKQDSKKKYVSPYSTIVSKQKSENKILSSNGKNLNTKKSSGIKNQRESPTNSFTSKLFREYPVKYACDPKTDEHYFDRILTTPDQRSFTISQRRSIDSESQEMIYKDFSSKGSSPEKSKNNSALNIIDEAEHYRKNYKYWSNQKAKPHTGGTKNNHIFSDDDDIKITAFEIIDANQSQDQNHKVSDDMLLTDGETFKIHQLIQQTQISPLKNRKKDNKFVHEKIIHYNKAEESFNPYRKSLKNPDIRVENNKYYVNIQNEHLHTQKSHDQEESKKLERNGSEEKNLQNSPNYNFLEKLNSKLMKTPKLAKILLDEIDHKSDKK